MKVWTPFAWLVLALGCGGPQDPAEEPLTASGHETEAEREELAAEELEADYDPDAQARLGGGSATGPAFHSVDVYNPTTSNLVEADAHRQHAEAHRERAELLRGFENAECSRFPPETRTFCPLLLGLVAVEPIEGGVRMRFAPEVDFSSVVDHVRCHIAYAAAQGLEGISDCALYVPGVRVVVTGQDLLLTTQDTEHVAELRRRVAQQAPAD